MDELELKEKYRRRASRAMIGGFPPSDDPLASWFGKVQVALPSEAWPISNGKPMRALGQFNLTEAPYRPENLADIAMITVFIDQNNLPARNEANGDKWLVRAYPATDGLIVIEPPSISPEIKPFPIHWELIEADYPTWDSIDAEKISPELNDNYYDKIEIQWGSKFGGWPSTIQNEVEWAALNAPPFRPEFAFQIDSEEAADWSWGDAGVGYFGRGVGASRDQWVLTWQCF